MKCAHTVSFGSAIAAVVVATGAAAQDPRGVAAAVDRWLMQSCGVGDAQAQVQELTALGPAAVPALVQAYEQGPATGAVGQADRAAARRFALYRRRLEQADGLGLSAADLARARAVTLAQFTARARLDFTAQYRGEALRGLGVLGGARAVGVLRSVSALGEAPYAAIARLALERIK
ncbi:MAG: hypothetical protein ACE5HT_03955 [Gemmatimonadales bacterium]